jgi:hypothetical protein
MHGEIEKIRKGKHGARSTKLANAIGLSEAPMLIDCRLACQLFKFEIFIITHQSKTYEYRESIMGLIGCRREKDNAGYYFKQ